MVKFVSCFETGKTCGFWWKLIFNRVPFKKINRLLHKFGNRPGLPRCFPYKSCRTLEQVGKSPQNVLKCTGYTKKDSINPQTPPDTWVMMNYQPKHYTSISWGNPFKMTIRIKSSSFIKFDSLQNGWCFMILLQQPHGKILSNRATARSIFRCYVTLRERR